MILMASIAAKHSEGGRLQMRLKHCHNTEQFRRLAKQRLPGPIFHYIDGAADDEVTYRRNTAAYEDCDLVPNVLAGVETVDMSTTVMGMPLAMPLFLSPTALQRLFHHDGEHAVARAAEKFGTLFGISSLGTASIEEIGAAIQTPKMFQLYYHKDKGLTYGMIERCKEAQFDAIALTVDTIVGGNRERDLITGFTSPPKLTLQSLASFALHPSWSFNYLLRDRFELSNLKDHNDKSTNDSVTVSKYYSKMLNQSMDWHTAADVGKSWGKKF
jgi:L-lactate dehydrogenase (cytochrome)